MGNGKSDAVPTTVLTASAVATLLRLPEADAIVLVGSGVKVPADWPGEYAGRVGQLDLTIADCSVLTGIPQKTFHNWRERGRLRVRVIATSRSQPLLVQPAELVRVLRLIADERNGTTEIAETPTQAARRGESDRADALAACDGG